MNGNIEYAKYLIEKGASVTIQCCEQAIHRNNLVFLEYLFIMQPSIIEDAPQLDSLLTSTILVQNSDAINYLVIKGANVNSSCSHAAPLATAIGTGNLAIVKLLVELGADTEGSLTHCILNNCEEIANYLLELGGTTDFKGHKYLNLTEKWIQDIAIRFNHPHASIIRDLQGNCSVDNLYNIVSKIINNPDLKYIDLLRPVLYLIGCQGGEGLKQKIQELNPMETTKYFNLLQLKHTYKGDKFVLTTQTSGNESENCPENIKQVCKTFVRDKKLYRNEDDVSLSDPIKALYVVDKNGTLYIASPENFQGVHHSHILKGTEGKTKLGDLSLYGYGKPVACGGHIEIEGGVISRIDNSSGHYSPNLDQFKLVCKYFYDLDILSQNTVMQTHDNDYAIDRSELETLKVGEILDLYPSL